MAGLRAPEDSLREPGPARADPVCDSIRALLMDAPHDGQLMPQSAAHGPWDIPGYLRTRQGAPPGQLPPHKRPNQAGKQRPASSRPLATQQTELGLHTTAA